MGYGEYATSQRVPSSTQHAAFFFLRGGGEKILIINTSVFFEKDHLTAIPVPSSWIWSSFRPPPFVMTEMLFDFASKLRSKEGGKKKGKSNGEEGWACLSYVCACARGREGIRSRACKRGDEHSHIATTVVSISALLVSNRCIKDAP